MAAISQPVGLTGGSLASLLEAMPGAACLQLASGSWSQCNAQWHEVVHKFHGDSHPPSGIDLLCDLVDEVGVEGSSRVVLESIQAGEIREASGQIALTVENTSYWFRFDIHPLTFEGEDALLISLLDVSRLVRSERHHFEKRLAAQRLANTDALTGKGSRRAVMADVRRAWRRWQTRQIPFTLILADIDNLKQINDHQGHLEGDKVIKTVAQQLGRSLRASDSMGRLGGDEFLIVLPGLAGPDARAVVERIRTHVNLGSGPVGVTLGFASAEAEDPNADEVIDRADRSLYNSKPKPRVL